MLKKGTVIDEKYEIQGLLGEGGMGQVYAALSTDGSGCAFAIKVLHEELMNEPTVVARFVREAQAAGAIGSPNIVGVIGDGTLPDGLPYLAMERLEGETLRDRVDRGPTDPGRAATIVIQICRALSAAHEKDIIHRDLKPGNVFVCSQAVNGDQIKVLDFGIAKLGGAEGLTKTGTVLGTPQYMSPEQLLTPKDVDAQSDVYAAGVILYEMLTGKLPFDGSSFGELVVTVSTSSPLQPRTLRPDIDERLEQIVMKALARDRADRYQTIGELGQDLEHFLATRVSKPGKPAKPTSTDVAPAPPNDEGQTGPEPGPPAEEPDGVEKTGKDQLEPAKEGGSVATMLAVAAVAAMAGAGAVAAFWALFVSG